MFDAGRIAVVLAPMVLFIAAPARSRADDRGVLPTPLGVGDAARFARLSRTEVVAARARADAAAQRPAIVSALEDPQILPALEHVPFMGGGANMSLTIQQSFPLSHIRGHRRAAAEADARREIAQIARVDLDVELDAAVAFWMLYETRETAKIVDEQRALAAKMVAAALARYAANTGAEVEVLRAQLEVARLDGEQRALVAEISASEAMLNASLARPVDAAIPELDGRTTDASPPPTTQLARTALESRPELRADRAEIARSEAEVSVMQAMYSPMAMVRTGPSYMMADGLGWTLMVGLSIPLWREKLGAGVAEARALVKVANADLETTRRMIGGEGAVARARVAAVRERFLALRETIVPKASEVIAATLAAYTANKLPLVSVIEAAQALWSVQRELVMAHGELGLAWARLDRAVGRGVTR